MRIVAQRVNHASVRVEGRVRGAIDAGLLLLLGIGQDDSEDEIEWLVNKTARLRIWEDDEGRMNRSLEETGGEVLLISQFTLFGNLAKGTRPSFNRAAPPDRARRLYEAFHGALQVRLLKTIPTGVFGAEMQIEASLDGPVTLFIDSQHRDF
ncbi:MAG: D-aminoacyl-tRNA deacylase [Opitutales bacterium]